MSCSDTVVYPLAIFLIIKFATTIQQMKITLQIPIAISADGGASESANTWLPS